MEVKEPRRILITGGAGFIGANFVHYTTHQRPQAVLVVLDILNYAGNPESLEAVQDRPNYHFVQGDICDRQLVDRLMHQHAIDTIVHFAAESHVDRSIEDPEAFVRTNILGTFTLLEVARGYWSSLDAASRPRHRFHHVSTDEVYGSLQPQDPAFTECTPYAPNSPYAASKAGSDHLVRAYYHTYGFPVTTSSCSNNYGPYQFPEKLIPLMLIDGLEGKPLPIYGDGLNIRDWLYVEDHCRAIDLILENGQAGEIYNVGGENESTNIKIVTLICQLLDEAFGQHASLQYRFPNAPAAHGKPIHSLIHFVKDRPGHDRRYAIDASKIAADLDYKPQERFETGIRKTIQWYIDHENWWRSVMDGRYRSWMQRHYGADCHEP